MDHQDNDEAAVRAAWARFTAERPAYNWTAYGGRVVELVGSPPAGMEPADRVMKYGRTFLKSACGCVCCGDVVLVRCVDPGVPPRSDLVALVGEDAVMLLETVGALR